MICSMNDKNSDFVSHLILFEIHIKNWIELNKLLFNAGRKTLKTEDIKMVSKN